MVAGATQSGKSRYTGKIAMNSMDSRPTPPRRAAQLLGLGLLLLLVSAVLGAMAPDTTKKKAKPVKKQPVAKAGVAPTFKAITLLKVAGKVVGDTDKITFGSPEFVDWDGDGKTDLLLGYWASWSIGPRRGAGDGGKVRFYKNISKADLPEYKDMGDLECDGGLVRLKEA
jgi:hypothetical protein